ncbi:HsdS1 [Desulforapulum autotrophicum HRM2]|uniref:HsdS1 n=1 Tax=Desulforapulum autotrophicum (strain ATCC 43914 / DSM 3382 / VKM B-1955 / HRM2) TaxID=177437 RepID=C0Q9L5_DESAH|nr:restriction endonuclease subunit S [Desulforapulum autotrophicum]ACN14579.1 HsdS1 [Desulforapulum autotrophicum HRM2]
MNYEKISISDFCKTGSGGTPSRRNLEFYKGSIPWIKSGELKEDIIYDSEEKISAEAIENSSAKIISNKAILVAMYGATIGRVAMLGVDAATNQAICNIIPDSKRADNRYLFYALQNAVPVLLSRKVGGGQPNISQTIIKDTKIPLPPIKEQKRIAAILDKADAIRRKREKAIELADEFLKSVFLYMFGDPVTNPKGWPEYKLSEISELKSGVTKGRKLDGKKTIAVPYMRVANVQDGHIIIDDLKEIEVLETDVEKFQLNVGDLLLTEGGDPDKLGRGAVWKGEINPCIHQNHIFRVRPDEKRILPEYLSKQIGSARGKRYFLSSAKQTTGVASINMTQLKNFSALVPPMSLQKEFCEIAAKLESIKNKMIDKLTNQEHLFNSLTQRAFRGDL